MRSTIAARPTTGGGTASGFRCLLQTELKLFLREPMLLFWGLLFPVGLLIVLGLAGGNKPVHAFGGLRLIVVYTPIVITFTLTILGISALPAALASYRDKGYLRRLSTTPVGAVRLLAAQIAIVLGLATCVTILVLLVAHFWFSVDLPRQLGGFILAVLLTFGAIVSLGTLIAALAPSQRVATAAGSLLFFPLMFFAGLWVPQAEMGAGLRDVSHYTPLGAATPAVQNAIAGQWPGTTNLLVLAGYAVLVSALATRLFRWDR